MGKKVLSCVLVFAVFLSNLAFPVYAAEPTPDIYVMTDAVPYVVDGENVEMTLTVGATVATEGVNGIEFVIPRDSNLVIDSVSLNGLVLTPETPYAYISGNGAGVADFSEDAIRVAFSKANGGSFGEPFAVNISGAAYNDAAASHIFEQNGTLSQLSLIDSSGEAIDLSSLTLNLGYSFNILSQTFNNQLNITQDAIAAIPATETLTLEADAVAVEFARAAYDALAVMADSQKTWLDGLLAGEIAALTSAEAQIAALVAVATLLDADIAAFKAVSEVVVSDESGINGLQTRFGALTTAQKAYVSEAGRLKLTQLIEQLSLVTQKATAFQQLYATAENYINTTPVDGTIAGSVTQQAMSALIAAVDGEAASIAGLSAMTAVQIDAAHGRLQTAVAAFTASILTLKDEKRIDLGEWLVQIDDLLATAVTGDQIGQYPIDAKTALENAAAAAREIYNNPSSTQVDYENGIALLNAERAIFESSVITELIYAKAQLQIKIAEAEALVAGSVYGDTEAGQYPPTSRQPLQDKVNAAKALHADPATTSAAALLSIDELDAAMAVFRSTVITAEFLLEREADALFADEGETTLASGATQTKITAVLEKVNLLNASSTKTALLAQVAKAQDLFDTPVRVNIVNNTPGTSLGWLTVGGTQSLSAEAYNSLGIKIVKWTADWSTSDAAVVSVDNGVVQGQSAGYAAVKARVTNAPATNGLAPVTVESTLTINVFRIPDLVVSNIGQNSFHSQDVTVVATRSGNLITIKEGSMILASGTGTATATVSAAGFHTITVESAGTTTQILNFTIDKTAPVVTIPGIADVTDASVTVPMVSFADANLNDATKSLYIEKYNGTTYDFVKTVLSGDTIRDAGSYRLVAFVKDKAGNETTAREPFVVSIDTAKPTVVLGGIQDVNTAAVTPMITLTGGTYAGSYYYVGTLTKPDLTTTAIQTGTALPALTQAGRYTISLTAYNPNVPQSPQAYARSFVIDLTAPTLAISGVANQGLYNMDVTPIITVSDPDEIDDAAVLAGRTTIQLTKNGTAVAYSRGSTISAEGTYLLTVSVTDSANKTTTQSLSFTIDKTKPIVQITNIQNGSTYYAAMTAAFSTDSDAVLSVTDENGAPILLTAGSATFAKVDGVAKTYTVRIKAMDAAGNVTLKDLTFIIDAIPVQFIVTGIVEGAVLKAIPTNISARVIDGSTETILAPTFTKADGSAFTGEDGRQALNLSYTKGATTYTKKLNFTLDTTAPEMSQASVYRNGSLQSGDFTVKTGDVVEIRATVNDASSTVTAVYAQIGSYNTYIAMNAASGNIYSGSAVIGTGNASLQAIRIFGVDQAGNIGAAGAANVTVDNTAPMAYMTLQPYSLPNGQNNYFTSNSMQIILESNDPNALLKYSLNGGAQAVYATGLTPAEGSNTLNYFAVDGVGNASMTKTATFLYDKTAPAAVVVNEAGGSRVNTAAIDLSGTVAGEGNKGSRVYVAKNGYTVAAVEIGNGDAFAVNGLKLTEGSNTFALYAKDLAGNTGTSTTFTVSSDTWAPVFEIEQTTDAVFTVRVNEVLDAEPTATFNGEAVDAGKITASQTEENLYIIETNAPVEGQNMLVVTGSDTVGNIGTGSFSTSYIAPNTAQNNVPVTDNTMIDIPSNAFGGTTILTVQSVEVEGTTEYKALGSPMQFSFTTKPTNPITVSTYVGIGLTGVGTIHISDAGVVDGFVPAITASPIPYGSMDEDQPYYDPTTGIIAISTKNFSIYQMGQDTTSPVITLTTMDFEITGQETAVIAGTIEDQDAAAKVTSVEIDGISETVSLTTPFTKTLNMSDGLHEVTLTATDTAGNAGSITVEYRVDKTAPTLTAVPETTLTGEATATIDLVIGETAEIAVYRGSAAPQNGGVVATATGAYALSVDLQVGSNTFIITATDAFGNSSQQTVTIERAAALGLTLDSTAVETAEETVDLSGQINVAADLFVNDVLKLNDQAAGSFTIQDYPLEIGLNTLIIKAIDILGNTTSQTVTATRILTQGTIAEGGNNGEAGNGNGGIDTGRTSGADAAVTTTVVKPITSLGGVVEFEDAGIRMNFAPNSVAAGASITVEAVKMADTDILLTDGTRIPTQIEGQSVSLSLFGQVYNFGSTQKLEQPVEVTFSFDPGNLSEAQLLNLGVYYLNQEAGQWEYMPGRIDLTAGTITVVLDHFSIYAVMLYEKTFADITNSWAKDFIEALASRHIINGMTQNSFAPQKNMTRAEFAKLIVSALGIEGEVTTGSFKDIKASDWYAEYVELAKANGIVSGYSDQTFKPNAAITRQEMAVMIMNAYGYMKDVDYKAVFSDDNLDFADAADVAEWAKQGVAGAKQLGIVGGKGDNRFDPKANATRAEVAKMIYTLLGLE